MAASAAMADPLFSTCLLRSPPDEALLRSGSESFFLSFLILILFPGSEVVAAMSEAADLGRSMCEGSVNSSGCFNTFLGLEDSPRFLITILGGLISSGLTSLIFSLGTEVVVWSVPKKRLIDYHYIALIIITIMKFF